MTTSAIALGAWRGALACFVVAALTGVLYRFQGGLGLATGLSLTNARHAHSHLMYFGWATPALMALILVALAPRSGALVRGSRVLFGALFATALATWPLFLAFGYESVTIGSVRLPPAAIASGLATLVWYAFALVYVRAARSRPRSRALWIWDVAVLFLVLSTAGAWGLSLARPLGLDDPLSQLALKHLFLDLFSEGWFVLGVLGLAWHHLAPEERGIDGGLVLLALGLPLGFVLALPAAEVHPILRTLAGVAGVASSLGLIHQVAVLWARTRGARAWTWRVPLLLLALAAIGRLLAAAVPAIDWAALPGVRLLYLHLLLLGFVTLGLWSAAERAFGRAAARTPALLHLSVGAVLGSLVVLSVIWPSAWSGPWSLAFAAAAAVLPPLVVAGSTRWWARREPGLRSRAMSALREWLEDDHRAIERLLARSVAGPAFDAAAFAELRGRLLRHIGIEEKILLVAAKRARGGVPLERAERLRRDHAAIAALLVPTPDAALARELRALLDPHEQLEEGPGGIYEECDALLAADADDVLAQARAYPPVPLAKHFDGPSAVRTAAEALALAARLRLARPPP